MDFAFDWHLPPWQGGVAKYRLGLRPISLELWFQPISDELFNYKKRLLKQRYGDVIQITPGSDVAQQTLSVHFREERHSKSEYPDVIANLSLLVADDLCLIEANGQQRLLAASVCSPTYWNVREKVGQSLSKIHEPVTGLEDKIGGRIARSISGAPLLKPFERTNWFIHSDQERFHLATESEMQGEPADWFVRSERETICRFHEDYALFTINVRFARLATIHQFPSARDDLLTSLTSFDQDEVEYFGGANKHQRLCDYLGNTNANANAI